MDVVDALTGNYEVNVLIVGGRSRRSDNNAGTVHQLKIDVSSGVLEP